MINNHERRKVHAKKASQLHPRRKGFHFTASLGRACSGISDLCDEYHLQPRIFYSWQKQFFENGAAAFVRDNRPQKRVGEVKIQQLEAKLIRKHEVLSELMEEHIKLKKELGEL